MPASQANPWAGAVEVIEIRVNRDQLLQHLRRIYANGDVPEVALAGPLSATAMGWKRDLMVVTRGLADIEPLPAEIGVKLDPLLSTLTCLDVEQVELSLEAAQLVCACPGRRIRIDTMDALQITTRPDPQVAGKLTAMFPEDAWQAFSGEVARGVVQAIQGLRVDRESARGGLALRVGPGGATIIVGDPMGHRVEFDIPEVRSESTYALLLPPNHVRAVFAVVGDSRPAIGLIGPNALMGLRLESTDRSVEPPEVEALYVISPREETRSSSGEIPRAEPSQDVGA